MNPLADELNSLLAGSVAGRLLSALGRRLYFPRGIIAQAAEAKKTAAVNATLGMAYRQGKPLILRALAEKLPALTSDEAVSYAPTAGVESFRTAWKQAMLRKNPSISAALSLPAVVPGITAGISYAADLFLDEGQTMLGPSPAWDNYSLVFGERRGGVYEGVPLFSGGGLNREGFRAAVAKAARSGTVRIILNFPHNPSGYTPVPAEADFLAGLFEEAAEGGADVLVLCDDAYFGLFYEDSVRESLFGRLAGLHEKILAVKIDGPTKEDYVWGLRTAFITFGSRGLDDALYAALEKKLMAVIRSSVSCANTPAQHLTRMLLEDPSARAEKAEYFALLGARYRAVKAFVEMEKAPAMVEAMPFNSGYFMCFRCKGIGAEALRQALLARGIGTIALGGEYLRVTFASLEESEIPRVYRAIYECAAELDRGS
ncbi:MAG: aminotransferase class I/II-fold pyridoxal phosphate-dependent enzyme [Treponema sp.]|jgi:aspartate/methionine/tyrosine aminotransferase|nr:aminotransferase class I/II-fold pyridoxal phosphate-dependent enzyme [Treponema sp.]